MAGYPDHSRIIRRRPDHHRACPDLHMIAYKDIPENLSSGPNYHVIAQRRMAFSLLVAGAAQGHTLVQQHIVADLRGFPDHYARAMIDEKSPPDRGPRMDFDARQKAAELGEQPRDQFQIPII